MLPEHGPLQWQRWTGQVVHGERQRLCGEGQDTMLLQTNAARWEREDRAPWPSSPLH